MVACVFEMWILQKAQTHLLDLAQLMKHSVDYFQMIKRVFQIQDETQFQRLVIFPTMEVTISYYVIWSDSSDEMYSGRFLSARRVLRRGNEETWMALHYELHFLGGTLVNSLSIC